MVAFCRNQAVPVSWSLHTSCLLKPHQLRYVTDGLDALAGGAQRFEIYNGYGKFSSGALMRIVTVNITNSYAYET